ncbi:forkhead box protein I2-like [Dendrobates tinctorius]|uniref:forkhead box protein I2-like n=1 Tax=Dendrobates tinctorius TaxID=92724 RepID=UPI003CC9E461
MVMDIDSRDCLNLHQQKLHQPWKSISVHGISDYPGKSADPYKWFGDSAVSPSYINGNGSRSLPSGNANSQLQVLAPSAGSREPKMTQLTPLNHNDLIKPVRKPYSASTLIIMALENAPEKKLTFSQICSYVVNNFPFYKRNEAYWKKVLRSNLYLNDRFKKEAWDSCDPRKEISWTLNPSCKKTLKNGLFKWQRGKNSEKKPSKELDHKGNMKCLRSDNPAGSPENKLMSPALDTSSRFANFTSAIFTSDIYEMSSNWASIQLMKDFSSYRQYSAELSTKLNDNIQNSSLPGEPMAQANVPQAMALPNQLEEAVLVSCPPSLCKSNPL